MKVIRKFSSLLEEYSKLERGDVFAGRVSHRHLKKVLLLDLLAGGVVCVPSALSQALNGSKAAQAIIFSAFMPPGTFGVSRRAELMEAMTEYSRLGISAVVTKDENRHCGHGIRRWDSPEALFNHMADREDAYPFVVQPFFEDYTDIRIIVAGGYVEAYQRSNPFNFRNNLSSGGRAEPVSTETGPGKSALELAEKVMARGDFPYAHVDIFLDSDSRPWLSEIALNGGIMGAKITRKDLDALKKEIEERLINHLP